MTSSNDDAVLAMARAGQALFGGLPGAVVLPGAPDVLGVLSGVPVPTLNGAWVCVEKPDLADLSTTLDACAGSGLPWCVQLRPGVDPAVTDLVRDRGLSHAFSSPMMVCEGGELDVPAVDGLVLEQVPPAEAHRHAAVVSAGMGMPLDMAEVLLTPESLAPPVRVYVGSVDGRDVVTSLGVRAADGVVVFNVATVESHRRRGLGAAATARAVSDGLADGARFAVLQSSDMAVGVYRGLGFEVRELWDVWVVAD